ncbi:MAG TPA: S41 family peptidase [Mobilitalea sp.]|nr:S41 family peptidase [Mobilitalea sp.]
MKKKWLKVLVGIVLTILILCGAGYTAWKLALDPYRETVNYNMVSKDLDTELTKEQAQEDLEYLFTHLKNYHPAYVDGSKELTDAVEKQYKQEVSQLGDTVTVLQMWQACTRITATMHDGHTGVYEYTFQKKYLDGNPNELADKEIISINGVAIEDLYKTFCSQFSYELDSYADYEFHNLIALEEYLRFLGINTTDGVDITYLQNDTENTVHYTFKSMSEETQPKNSTDYKFVTYSIDEATNSAMFTLTACDYNDEYLTILEEFFTKVKEAKIGNIIVDLRNNGGGNSMVVNAFLSYLNIDSYQSYYGDVRFGPILWKSKSGIVKNEKQEKVFDGRLYVLTSSQTFSSANMFAVMVSDNKIGTIVGEITGNMPSSYGDVLSFRMPNSRLYIGVSGKVFHRPDSSLDSEPLIPDVQVDAQNALSNVYELIGKK